MDDIKTLDDAKKTLTILGELLTHIDTMLAALRNLGKGAADSGYAKLTQQRQEVQADYERLCAEVELW